MNPFRTCVACKQTKNKDEMLRITLYHGAFAIDEHHRAPGRGCYICKSAECIAKCVKTRALNRSFKQAVPNEIYVRLGEIQLDET